MGSGVGALQDSLPCLPRGCAGEPVLGHACRSAIQGRGVVSSAGVWSLAAAPLFTASFQLPGTREGALGSEPSCPPPHPSALGKLEPPLEFHLPHSSQCPRERQLPGSMAILPKGCCCEPLAADTHSGCWSWVLPARRASGRRSH